MIDGGDPVATDPPKDIDLKSHDCLLLCCTDEAMGGHIQMRDTPAA